MGIERGDRVRVDYIATLPGGDVLDTSVRAVAEEHGLVGDDIDQRSFEPIEFVVGEGGPLADIEGGLLGMEEGDVDTAEAEFREDVRVEYDREEWKTALDAVPEEGMHVEAEDGTTGTVVDVTGDTVVVDFSHPLAGETVEFKIRIRRIA